MVFKPKEKKKQGNDVKTKKKRCITMKVATQIVVFKPNRKGNVVFKLRKEGLPK